MAYLNWIKLKHYSQRCGQSIGKLQGIVQIFPPEQKRQEKAITEPFGRAAARMWGLWWRDTADLQWPGREGGLGTDAPTSLLYAPDFLQVLFIGSQTARRFVEGVHSDPLPAGSRVEGDLEGPQTK